MFFILLRFSIHADRVAEFLEAHTAWLAQGFEEGVFLSAGAMSDGDGEAILAVAEDLAAVEARVARDPFVIEGVMEVEITGMAPTMLDDRLSFLLGEG
ncbi:YciI-like protein [Tritonibacter multivorans]|uniref:YciI-like protein n=1 Tax=Tritonibacter multivorans TaxID=928856 RepID=A0A0P1GYI9_9RHOB|nr:YciI family protein [Tritonibacter multivorans]MDA7420753.1 YciI family protein [Tritonibacter multivorans]CUH81027.1 YciI-like protein [Tritonibacter multivorans]SFC25718.1 Uncharacterized conserved protein YciI, contains a putative active-site phosphohistidine [Tritonibacter multivorans]